MILGPSNPDQSRSSAIAGKIDERQALAAIVLWNSGHFDTYDIGAVLHIAEDAVYRTLHAARAVAKGQA